MRVAFLIGLLFYCSIGVSAQSDSMSTVKLYVRDVSKQAVSNVEVKVFEIFERKSEFYDLAYAFKKDDFYFVHLGLEKTGTFLIRIGAKGFESKEFKVFFAGGHMQTVTATLKRTGSQDSEDLERTIILSGLILDQSGRRVKGARITAIDQCEKRFEWTTEENGYFAFNLPYVGLILNPNSKVYEKDRPNLIKYTLRIEAEQFKVFEAKDILVTNSDLGKMRFDVVLSRK